MSLETLILLPTTPKSVSQQHSHVSANASVKLHLKRQLIKLKDEDNGLVGSNVWHSYPATFLEMLFVCEDWVLIWCNCQGYMYVEAYKEAHVMEAIRGLRNVLVSKGAKLVPLSEMVEAITVNTKAKKAMGETSYSTIIALWAWLIFAAVRVPSSLLDNQLTPSILCIHELHNNSYSLPATHHRGHSHVLGLSPQAELGHWNSSSPVCAGRLCCMHIESHC